MLSTCFSVASIGRQSLARAVPDEAPPSTWWHHLRSLVGWNRPAVGRLSSREQPCGLLPHFLPQSPHLSLVWPWVLPQDSGWATPPGRPKSFLVLRVQGWSDSQSHSCCVLCPSSHNEKWAESGAGKGRRKTGVS